MAQNVKVAGASYLAVPSVKLPLASGSGNALFCDTSGVTAGASDVAAGKIIVDATGASVTGTATSSSGGSNAKFLSKIEQSAPYSLSADDLAGLTQVGSNAFNNDAELTGIALPSTVTSIGSQAFLSCTGLKSISTPSSVATISSFAFGGCPNLVSASFSSGLIEIATYGLYNCIRLAEVDIPSTCTSIGSNAFYGMPSGSVININRSSGAISGSPWGATNATINWTGTT